MLVKIQSVKVSFRTTVDYTRYKNDYELQL